MLIKDHILKIKTLIIKCWDWYVNINYNFVSDLISLYYSFLFRYTGFVYISNVKLYKNKYYKHSCFAQNNKFDQYIIINHITKINFYKDRTNIYFKGYAIINNDFCHIKGLEFFTLNYKCYNIEEVSYDTIVNLLPKNHTKRIEYRKQKIKFLLNSNL